MEMTLEELNRAYERLRAVREIENMMGRYSFFTPLCGISTI